MLHQQAGSRLVDSGGCGQENIKAMPHNTLEVSEILFSQALLDILF